MAKYELRMPKMGESIIEATILNWVKEVGDKIEMDDTIVEIATDKVDSEVPSPVEGVLLEKRFEVDDVVPIDEIIAIIGTGESSDADDSAEQVPATSSITEENKAASKPIVEQNHDKSAKESSDIPANVDGQFFSPLVRSIAAKEGVSLEELQNISGTGKNNRVSKADILAYLNNRTSLPANSTQSSASIPLSSNATSKTHNVAAPTYSKSSHNNSSSSTHGDVEIIEMDRMRKMIAKHMVDSVQTSPHVTSFVEADLTNIVNWRNKVKKGFQEKYGQKITFTPIFIEAIVKAIQDFPQINASVDGDRILVKKSINIGMAAALPSGNLIVPVIHHADELSLLGITKKVNDLAARARKNQLKPEEINGGTYTLTNVGTFGNVLGTPIINQPQVAIMAAGAIQKKPAVLETADGDVIAIRHKMFLSHSYDHRVVDGVLGGSFVRKVADYLEQFDPNRDI